MSKKQELILEEIRDAYTGNISPLSVSEIAEVISAKTQKEAMKKLKKYARKYK